MYRKPQSFGSSVVSDNANKLFLKLSMQLQTFQGEKNLQAQMVFLVYSTKYLKKKSANSTQCDTTTYLLEWLKKKKILTKM